ncbi:Hsp20/alpha crystallin family protein [Domibacillus sp. DTU_2020_1001157_1_SI_ALB_TIR_016]|uniref:Hsp20/alpha crystallin family protein n=1 Tax=Domibacillus sp. DTU_2020_1001157_1_SI_ALB_TIR_016 TaxID=3077789 RepID=UPI0028E1E63C|nr:Hsp20/alpha crystallin family protein [Domibacillus sp. DTU_2020_1001157_1_SI_ALB_TIR_016]WNS77809.1 Hsp20/alpha crystallin family protein [Domibacillus sp. DTU_2020_1001157_1_SI_ALB_TIR_016]
MDFNKKNLPDLFQGSVGDLIKSFDSFFNESMKYVGHYFSQPISDLTCYETGSNMVIEAELKNCRKEQIQIYMLRNGQVKISVENITSTTAQNDKDEIILQNQSVQKVERIVALPCSPGTGKVKATFKHGLLRVIIPKREQAETIIEID